MSLSINVAAVAEVLLVDGWHTVAPGSFGIDSYEYVSDETGAAVLVGGTVNGVVSHGYTFVEKGSTEEPLSRSAKKDAKASKEVEAPEARATETRVRMVGPLSALLAVRETQEFEVEDPEADAEEDPEA